MVAFRVFPNCLIAVVIPIELGGIFLCFCNHIRVSGQDAMIEQAPKTTKWKKEVWALGLTSA